MKFTIDTEFNGFGGELLSMALPATRTRRMSPRDIELLAETIAHDMASFLERDEAA